MEVENMKLTFRDITEFLFLPLMTAAVFILWDLNKSVSTLNVQVGVLIANNSTLEKRVDGLEKRIEKLEDKQTGNVAQK
jgi:cell division protein FtsB